jgi:hypothetical protein
VQYRAVHAAIALESTSSWLHLQEPYNVTVVGPEYVEYTAAADAELADVSILGTAVFVVSNPNLALPSETTTAGNLTYNVTSPSQVNPSFQWTLCRMQAFSNASDQAALAPEQAVGTPLSMLTLFAV